ncbi:MAG: hypothetical protein FWD86_02945, partial [Firmicutes bacterium]|nr:hypothetical protein [Bacillota bacterium]
MKNIYTLYRNRLIEISGRSRSLYSKGISKRQAFNLGKLLDDTSEAKAFVDFLWNTPLKRFKLLNATQTNSLTNDVSSEAKKRAVETAYSDLKALQREMDSFERETGRYEMFVGYPFVTGTVGQVQIKAPLLLFPAKINSDKGLEIEIMRDDPVVLNKVFLLAYSKELKIDIEELDTEFENPIFSRFESVKSVLDYLKKAGLTILLNKQKLITDIEKYRDESEVQDQIEVKNYAVVGRFPLANAIYNDYRLMEKNRLSSPAIDALLHTKDIKSRQKNDQRLYNIRQLDYAQEESIASINKHSNVVIYGPPGTGKSQVVTNIISDALCKNLRVLLVSQKRTALDVVYNRLGNINTKSIILPDPEKSKNEFYEKVRIRFSQVDKYKKTFNPDALSSILKNLNHETKELESISDTLFSKTSFGVTMQKMYLKSARLGKNSLDYHVFEKIKNTSLMDLKFEQMDEAVKSIRQKNAAELFYNHYLLAKDSPIVEYIKPGLEFDVVNRLKTYIQTLLNDGAQPFNLAKYEYSRYLMAYTQVDHFANLKPLANMVAVLNHPKLNRGVKFSGIFPPAWPLFPFLKASFNKKRKAILRKLEVSRQALREYASEFELIKSALEPDGLSMMLDGITFGNLSFLKKMLAALDDYMTLKDMILAMKALSATEKNILDFAKEITTNKRDFVLVTELVLPVRIYHEIVLEE